MYVLHYLIKVTGNSLSAFLMISLLCVVVSRFLRDEKKTYLLWALVSGIVPSVVFAVLKRTTGIAVREYYDLGVLLPSVVFSFFLFCLMFLTFMRFSKVYIIIFRVLVFCVLGTWVAYCLPNLLLYPFEFAVGMDTIFNTDFMYKVTGYLLGILLMVLLALALYSVADKLSDTVILIVFTAGLGVTLAFQVLTVAQILLGRNLIPRYRWLMTPVMWALTHVEWFMYALMGLAFFISLILLIRIKITPITGENPALRRKMRSGARRQMRHGAGVLAGLMAVLLLMTVGQSYANRGVELSPPIERAVTEGKILIPLEEINDGNLHRFFYRASDGTEMRYIVIRKSEVAYGVGLDACDVCGASGYYQRKDQVICILCDVVMNISTIGFPGGCNPVPLKYAMSEGSMVIDTKDLEAEKRRFQ